MRPTWGQIRKFCLAQGYQERRGDHDRYTKVINAEFTSGTMISHGADAETVPSQMWRMVWSRQLLLSSEEEFWKGVDGQAVQYAVPPTPVPQKPLPEYLQRHLRDVLHWPENRIAHATRDEAQDLLNAFYASKLRET